MHFGKLANQTLQKPPHDITPSVTKNLLISQELHLQQSSLIAGPIFMTVDFYSFYVIIDCNKDKRLP